MINPNELRVALANHTPFQCQEMNDASELLDTIFECFSKAQVRQRVVVVANSERESVVGREVLLVHFAVATAAVMHAQVGFDGCCACLPVFIMLSGGLPTKVQELPWLYWTCHHK